MSFERVEQAAHLEDPFSGAEAHILGTHRAIPQFEGYALDGPGHPLRLDHSNELGYATAEEGKCSWDADGSALCSTPAARFTGPNLPRKPQIWSQGARYDPSGLHNKKARMNRSVKEKRRPVTYAVLEPVAPMSSTPYPLGRHSARPSPQGATYRRQPSKERRGDKENCPFPSSQSPGMDGEPRTAHKPRYVEVPSPCSAALSSDASSLSPDWSSGSLDTSSSSSGFLQTAGAFVHLAPRGDPLPIHLLDGLSDSPHEIIAELKATSGHSLGCAKWMMVAGHYRSKGNVLAALAVVTDMIEVMLGVGMELSQLKPATLMLSSCHLDIAKELRAQAGDETTESKYHFDKGCDGLRTVYGAFVPPSGNSTTQAGEHPFCSSSTSVSANHNAGGERATLNALSSSGAHHRSPEFTQSPRYSQLKILEREVQSLRDRQEDQSDALQHTRTAKRKLEEDLEAERHIRRKLERRLGQAESDASGAQKGERNALERCREEAETRRRAEVRAEDMRQEAAEVRAALEPKIAEYGEWERKFKDFFGKLGIVFLKAARGEFGEVLNGRP